MERTECEVCGDAVGVADGVEAALPAAPRAGLVTAGNVGALLLRDGEDAPRGE